MPWKKSQAKGHSKKAKTPKLQRMWRDVANGILKKTGNDGLAVRIANGVVKKAAGRKKK